ncbi:MAG: hypothetical protein LBG45_10075 [Dysgonamonadaceae bacterium]|nr:hypothetical protein [Dysgonamonadaceae bacterium]
MIEMTLNGSGVRDTGRVLKISKDTVCSVLKTGSYFPLCLPYIPSPPDGFHT